MAFFFASATPGVKNASARTASMGVFNRWHRGRTVDARTQSVLKKRSDGKNEQAQKEIKPMVENADIREG